jgi:hypothetical protein
MVGMVWRALTEVAQHLEHHEGGQAPQDGVQVAGSLGRHDGIHVHELQCQGAEIECQHGDGRHHQREPEALVHGGAHLVLLAGAVELGNDGGEGHDDALHQQDDRQPEAGRHRHGGRSTALTCPAITVSTKFMAIWATWATRMGLARRTSCFASDQ